MARVSLTLLLPLNEPESQQRQQEAEPGQANPGEHYDIERPVSMIATDSVLSADFSLVPVRFPIACSPRFRCSFRATYLHSRSSWSFRLPKRS